MPYEKSSSEGQARQKQAKKRRLRAVNEQSEPVFNAASPSAGTFRTAPRARATVDRCTGPPRQDRLDAIAQAGARAAA
ncbi:hypothetical protein FM069_21045 [Pseudomonas mangiferae]|uniref:Uncharacterized protein n=1 Tax=Pseudomonas mangiferae TaxID=2593654 RepID=A0A553GTD8_9PSED|nr:hypothetical protein FM069_21045 [Pseudomonas mangiferae]